MFVYMRGDNNLPKHTGMNGKGRYSAQGSIIALERLHIHFRDTRF